MKKSKQVFIFFGPPGSGKGTQSDMLSVKLGLPAVSTGELLRNEQRLKTKLGKDAARYMKQGKLAPDKIVEALMDKRLLKRDMAKGFILDGYPRNQSQLDDLLRLLKDRYDIWLIEVRVQDKEVINRLSGRRICPKCGANFHLVYNPPKKIGICNVCGSKLTTREDDKLATVRGRLSRYKDTAEPLLIYAKKHKKLMSINGEQSIAKVQKDILAKITKLID
jgi:adenylate kinase